MSSVHLWLRHETRSTERRAPLVPHDAARLVADGVRVTVEESPQRVFDVEAYRAGGCHVTPAGSWVDAPDDAHVLGIKELPDEPAALRHTHIFFGHAYKGQDGAGSLLARFAAGGGELLDLEYLTVDGRRVIAFGYWAGYVGAALGVLAARGALAPLHPMERAELDALVRAAGADGMSALVVGAQGRSGRGALDALLAANTVLDGWDREDTRVLDREALLDHELLVNCVLSTTPQPAFVRPEDLTAPRALRVVADVTCDVTSEHNLVPVNTAITSWEEPARRVGDDPPLDVIAVDNLPSLLPREASVAFSADLVPLVPTLAGRRGPWREALRAFVAAQAHRAGGPRAVAPGPS
ncbi:saccharopine dehydrogenase [Phycicoccus sonneratiae]|uniref:Saccharopine dehydrogenase n=1 Tax=Phycicoccus sonneratiae TaxID=2807628 RepID=A0ABS2CLN2_9MICO|nr:saccharopine dehydrogenase [Phycicoccus sonneraticus]MBM6400807.1 saccharopine dehydrogenase [Phycicoccus sonneraticus]